MKTKYTITLDAEIVEEVKIRLKSIGGKLSSLINNLLFEWIRGQKMREQDTEEFLKWHNLNKKEEEKP